MPRRPGAVLAPSHESSAARVVTAHSGVVRGATTQPPPTAPPGRYFELKDEAPYQYYVSDFRAKDPQRGACMLPKRSCDVRRRSLLRTHAEAHARARAQGGTAHWRRGPFGICGARHCEAPGGLSAAGAQVRDQQVAPIAAPHAWAQAWLSAGEGSEGYNGRGSVRPIVRGRESPQQQPVVYL